MNDPINMIIIQSSSISESLKMFFLSPLICNSEKMFMARNPERACAIRVKTCNLRGSLAKSGPVEILLVLFVLIRCGPQKRQNTVFKWVSKGD